MNPWFLLAAVIALGVATGGAYIQGRSDGKAHCLSEQLRDEAVAAIASEAAASATAQAISQMKVRHTTIKQEVQREIETRVEYRDCRHAPDILRRINSALTGKDEPASGGELSGASAPSR